MKQIIFRAILFLTTGFILSLLWSQTVSASTLIINPPFGTVESGNDLTVDVIVSGTDELIDGVDANVAYDQNFLKVKELKKGIFFKDYPTFKDNSGQVQITALASAEGVKLTGEQVVATLVFEILDSGDTKLEIAFKKDATGESNVAQHGTAVDLLTEVGGGKYTVTASEEKLQAARAKKARSNLIPFLIFIVLLIVIGLAIWYYRKKRKPKEDYFVPEPFPMDETPPSESGDNKAPPAT